MMQKKSFILHIDSLQILSEISDELAGRLIKAIANYQQTGEEPSESDLRFLFLPFKYQFVRDSEKYVKQSLRNKENGAKGGRGNKAKESEKSDWVNSLSGKAKKADSDSDSDSDSERESDSVINTPTFEQVEKYFHEKGYSTEEAKLAFDYYNDNNWNDKDGKRVKNWKGKFRSVWMKEPPKAPARKTIFSPEENTW